LQLRLHPALRTLKEKLALEKASVKHDVDLTYITARGNWYLVSWKGQAERSGGLVTNIGIHFFDLLIWLFGPVESCDVHFANERKISGHLQLQHARVKWFLSIDINDLPDQVKQTGKTTFRSITVDNKEVEFSEGFADLHTEIYRDILAGNGFGPEDARASIQTVYNIRNAQPTGVNPDSHEFLKKALGTTQGN
jgi:UDP-N-acetyl-2-amino-2-deoxyglucuronate dehydrogenase